MFLVLLLPTAGIMLFSYAEIDLPSLDFLLQSLWLPPAATLLVFSVSLLISLVVYDKKEFS